MYESGVKVYLNGRQTTPVRFAGVSGQAISLLTDERSVKMNGTSGGKLE
jgi:hypothetical protein